MTVTNAYWLHWVTYILSRSRLLSLKHIHTHFHPHSTKMLIAFIWLWISVIETNPMDMGEMKRAFVRGVFSPLFHTPSQTHTHSHKHASAQHLNLEGNNTTLCSEVQYVLMCILKSCFVLLKHVYGLCVNWVAVESLSFYFFQTHTHTHIMPPVM